MWRSSKGKNVIADGFSRLCPQDLDADLEQPIRTIAMFLDSYPLEEIAIDKAQIFYPHIKFICEDAETIKHDKQYDLIINSQTLEHVDNPKIIIKNMMKLSKKNGVIFITVPYPNSNLDRGVKLHHWTFYEKDFKDIMGQHTECIKIDKNHLGVIWENI